MELQCGNDLEAVDLSGDAGVVGRWLIQGDKEQPELCMDLKGVILSATMVRSVHSLRPPCLTTHKALLTVVKSSYLSPSKHHIMLCDLVLW